MCEKKTGIHMGQTNKSCAIWNKMHTGFTIWGRISMDLIGDIGEVDNAFVARQSQLCFPGMLM